jgi:NifU-like protein involved in Fe-S cluster formation
MAAAMNAPVYTTTILRLAASIPHLGHLELPHGRAELRSPTCGSRAQVEVRLDESGRVLELAQEIEACAFGQASASLMGAQAIGRDQREATKALAELSDWLAGTSDHPGSWPGLGELAPAKSRTGRHGAILLPFRALLAAIEDATR